MKRMKKRIFTNLIHTVIFLTFSHTWHNCHARPFHSSRKHFLLHWHPGNMHHVQAVHLNKSHSGFSLSFAMLLNVYLNIDPFWKYSLYTGNLSGLLCAMHTKRAVASVCWTQTACLFWSVAWCQPRGLTGLKPTHSWRGALPPANSTSVWSARLKKKSPQLLN